MSICLQVLNLVLYLWQNKHLNTAMNTYYKGYNIKQSKILLYNYIR